jgi:O-antigen/teichoic acid export membrane protein
MPHLESLVRYLPAFLRERLEGRPNLWRILTNVGWLTGDRILRLGVGLLITVWIARYLGKANFGLLNYVTAFVGLFLPLAMLGLDNIVVRDLVHDPARRDETLGTSFVMKLAAGVGTLTLALAVFVVLEPDQRDLYLLAGLVGTTLLFQACDTVDFWFQSQVRSKYTVVARNTSFLIVSALRVGFLLAAAPLVAFVAAIAIEAAIAAIALLVVYQVSGGRFRAWRATRTRAVELLRASWPLIVSGVAIVIYMRIAQVMLGRMLGDLGDAEVGIFAAAVRISEVWYFVPTVVTSSVLPTIINARKTDAALYQRRMQQLLGMMALLGYAVAIPVSLLAGPAVWLLYGPEFAEAGPVLAVHIWAGLFVCLGVAQSAWMINEGRTGYLLVSTVLGAVINVGLNYLLIPEYGAFGAAIATLVSYGITVVVICFFYGPARPVARMTAKALLLRR